MMIYSAGCEYAIRAVTRLAQQTPAGGFCLLRDIIEEENLPEYYVGKLLQALVRADILISSKGRGGGFALRGSPKEIRLRSIVEAIDGREKLDRCVLGLSVCDNQQVCPQHDRWSQLRVMVNEMLDSTTVADLVEASAKKQAAFAKAPHRK